MKQTHKLDTIAKITALTRYCALGLNDNEVATLMNGLHAVSDITPDGIRKRRRSLQLQIAQQRDELFSCPNCHRQAAA